MAKINSNMSKEIVDNHTTEEVVAWMETSLRGLLRYVDEHEESDKAYVLGQTAVNLSSLYGIAKALNDKLSPKDPVVA